MRLSARLLFSKFGGKSATTAAALNLPWVGGHQAGAAMPDAEEIGVHLERAGIGQYTAAFEDAGYDDFAFLSDLPADTLRTELAEGVDDLPY